MAKVTWLGEDTKDVPGPSFTTWGPYKFPKGRAVEVTNEDILSQARGNRYYKVVEPKPDQDKPEGVPSAKTPEAKTEAKPAQAEAKTESRKDPRDYPPVKKAPKKQVRKPKAAAHAHR